jgi:hypothetical protein
METFKIVLSLIAVLTSVGCMLLLFRGYFGTGQRILLWSAFCFVGQSVNNLVLFVDLVVLPQSDLRVLRLTSALVGMLFLIYGFIRETD